MYSKEESKSLRKEFWTSFGVYMKKYNKVYQGKINWVNYNTKCKDIYFRLDVNKKKASFSFDLQHRDSGLRELFYDKQKRNLFGSKARKSVQKLLTNNIAEQWLKII